MRLLPTLLLLGSLFTPAWAQDPAPTKPVKPKRQPNVITLAEIDEIRAQSNDAYEIVRRLRPQFLKARGPNSFGNSASTRTTAVPKVILDGTVNGDVEALAQISANLVKEIRYLSMSDATTQYGTGFDGGAILVFTR